MERKIGEQFDYNGVTLEVAEDTNGNYCGDCYFLNNCVFKLINKTGNCSAKIRSDNRSVHFKEVKK